MRHFRTLLAHELRTAALAGNTWFSAALFLTLMGAVHWFAVLDSAEAPQAGTPLEATFQLFWIPLLCVLPLLTMRSLRLGSHYHPGMAWSQSLSRRHGLGQIDHQIT